MPLRPVPAIQRVSEKHRDPVFFRYALILISNKKLYLKSRMLRTLVPHVPCGTPSHKSLTRSAL